MCDWLLRTIHGHLVDLGGVVLLNVSQDPDVIVFHKVDGHALTTITTGPANPEAGRSEVMLAASLLAYLLLGEQNQNHGSVRGVEAHLWM